MITKRIALSALFAASIMLPLVPVVSFAGQASGAKQYHHRTTIQAKVIMQISDNDPGKWNLALNNARNIQTAIGKNHAIIEIVAYGPGINMLKFSSVVGNRIAEALANGVRINACQNTMHAMHLTPPDMLQNIGYVPSGVVEIIKKEQEGFSYIRP